MKVDRTRVKEVTGPYQSSIGRHTPRDTNPSVSQAKAPEDAVRLSEKARLAHSITALLKDVPEVRIDLVMRLKAQVESGEYQVTADKVAERILKSGVLDE